MPGAECLAGTVDGGGDGFAAVFVDQRVDASPGAQVTMSASMNRTPWKSAIGLPNCLRSWA